jgi:phenylacetate-CoA ligase
MTTPAELQHRFHGMLLDSQFWTPAQLCDYQRGQLDHLLRHARANAPFYERRLDPVFRADGTIDWDRWSDLPIITRPDMVERRDAMQARELPPGHGPSDTVSTSGSTGVPVTISVSALFGIANDCLRWRGQDWNGIDWSKNIAIRLGSSEPPLGPPFGTLLGGWGPPWMTGPRGERWHLNVRLPGAEVLRFINDRRIAYLNTGASSAHIYALDALRLGIETRFEAVLAQGRTVTPEDRDICERVFGARIMEHYSSKEGGQMAHPCPHGKLHINSEACLVEIVDREGSPVPPGTAGRLVVTPFFNTAQPLIRYDQGDIATLGAPCTCGRGLPVLGSIVGRGFAVFSHPDGRRSDTILPETGRAALACSLWQVAQVGPTEFEIRYVPKDVARPADEEEFARIFHRQFFEDSRLRFVRVAEIPLSPGGKHLEYVNEFERG